VTVLRWCRVAFWTNLGLLVFLGSIFIGLHESHVWIRGILVGFRNGLMTRSSANPLSFTSSPGGLVGYEFYVDSPAVVAGWRSRLPHDLISAGVSTFEDEVERAKAVVLSFSRIGENRPIYRLSLLDKIGETQRGNGFCSDYVEVFLALSEVNGLTAREVQNNVHGFADFFSPSRLKWIFVDPEYAILATDEAGVYLSSLELRQRRLMGLPVRFVFFGTADGSIKSETDPRFQASYGDASLFKRYVLTYGNNVLTEASRSESLAFLPWEARQLLLYASGTKPHLLLLADSFTEKSAQKERWYGAVFVAISGYFVIALGCYPTVVLWARVMAWKTSGIRQHAGQPNQSSVA